MIEYKIIDCGPGQVEDRVNECVADGYEIERVITNILTQFSHGEKFGQYVHYSVFMTRESATAAGVDSLQTLIDLCKQHLFDTCTCREDWTSRRMIDPECLYHDGHNEIFEAIRAIEATAASEET